MFKYFFRNLFNTELLAFITALATFASLIIEASLAPTFSFILLIPIGFISIYIALHVWRVGVFSFQTFSAIPIPYFFCLAQNYEWYLSAMKQQESHIKKEGVTWDGIQRTFRIHRQDWAFFDSSKLGEDSSEWIRKTREISHHFDHLANRIETQPLFHVFVAAPAPVALGVGALFAGRGPFTVHQHGGMAKEPYKKIHDSNKVVTAEDGYHILNKQITSFELIEIKNNEPPEIETLPPKSFIVLDFTGHRLPKPYPIEKDTKVLRLGMIDEEGHISLNTQWMKIAQELCSKITSELNDGRKVSVLLGVPSTMAFLMGTILRTSTRIDVFYFNRSLDKYHKVFNLSDLD